MRRRTAVLLLVMLLSGLGPAQPGALLEVIPTGSYSTGTAAAQYAGRFRNDGESPPSAVTAVDSYLLRFESMWPTGEPTNITAQLLVPASLVEPRMLLVFGPGSTGLVEACAPSRGFVDSRSFETYGAYSLAFAAQGVVTIMPNYMGFFDVGRLQPYFDRVAEGRVMLDSIRAALSALEGLDVDTGGIPAFVAGYSQGGHAAFAAADLHAEYAPETPLIGVLGFGPTTIMSNMFLEFTFVAPWVIHAAATHLPGEIDPARLLREPYLSRLADDAERLCILEAQSYYPASPEALFHPDFYAALTSGTVATDYPEVAAFFAANDAGLSGHGLPAIILQGVDDPVVHIESQHEFVRQLCEDSPVRYPNYLRTRHETRYIGFQDALEWMRLIASGQEPPSDCAAVPAP